MNEQSSENARVENAGVEHSAPDYRAGKCGTSNMDRWKSYEQDVPLF